jgi:hypothetical protein
MCHNQPNSSSCSIARSGGTGRFQHRRWLEWAVRSDAHFHSAEPGAGPQSTPRLVEIIINPNDRIQEARMNGWLGEVQG